MGRHWFADSCELKQTVVRQCVLDRIFLFNPDFIFCLILGYAYHLKIIMKCSYSIRGGFYQYTNVTTLISKTNVD